MMELRQLREVTETVVKPQRSDPCRSTILIVDDEPLVLKYCAKLIEKNFDVPFVCASNADQAYAMLCSNDNIGVVLTDMRMPGRHDGGWLVDQAKQRRTSLQCIVMTAYSYDKPASADAMISKPWNEKSLVSQLNMSLLKAVV